MSGPLDSSSVPTATVVGGTFNVVAPTPVNGQSLSLQQDASGNLLVNIAAGTVTATNPSVGLTGANVPGSATYVAADNPSGKLTGLAVDASGNLLVNVAAGGSAGVQFADNAASGATPTGTLAMGWDSVNSKVRALKVDSTQNLLVDVANASIAVTQSTNPWIVSVQNASLVVTQGTTPWAVSLPATPVTVQQDWTQFDDDGFLYVNPNVPGADIATGDKQTQQLAVLQQIATGVSVTGITTVAGTVNVSSFPAIQPISLPFVPVTVQQDPLQYDDDGFQFVNPNVPGADIATGDKQTQQLIVLQQIATGVPKAEGQKATYSAFASFTPVAGDIALLPGSGTKTIRITRVEVSLSTTGTAAIEAVQLIKRSTADTAGTSAAMATVSHDANSLSASSVPLSYTAAPILGTAVGTVRGVQFSDASGTLPGANTWLWTFGDRPSGTIVLRGAAQQLCINLGAVVATQTATVSFEWTEE